MTVGAPTVAVYAGFWRRFLALLLDVLFVLLAIAVIAAITGGRRAGMLGLLFTVVYTVGLTMEGGTLGKRALGLRVVRSDGTPVGATRAALRELVGRPASSLALYLGYLWMLDDPLRQTWHDKLGDTVVVREVPAVAAPSWGDAPPWRDPTPASPTAPPPAPVTAAPATAPPGPASTT